MSYINAKVVLPKELIKEIQKYVNGVDLYIPKVPKVSNDSIYKNEIYRRNKEIYELFSLVFFDYHMRMTDEYVHDKLK